MKVLGRIVLAAAILLTLVVMPGHGRERIPGAPRHAEKQQASKITPPASRGTGSIGFENIGAEVSRAMQEAESALADADVQERLAQVEQLDVEDCDVEDLADLAQVEMPRGMEAEEGQQPERADSSNIFVISSDDGQGWLGVTIAEVIAEKVKELKLPAERGALVTAVQPDSPAAKAGLKPGDVITELGGQRIEGTAQFRRLVHEIPAGRQVALTVWRDGRAQMLSATLEALRGSRRSGEHYSYSWPDGEMRIPMPAMPAMPPMPAMPAMPAFPGELFTPRTPRLGIDVEDLSGDLGKYFGAPDGEGVLVREVRAGSPAEKGGLKAGDVIIKIGGERVKTASDLRAGLRAKRESKTVDVVVVRKGTEITLPVEVEPVTPPEGGRIARRMAV